MAVTLCLSPWPNAGTAGETAALDVSQAGLRRVHEGQRRSSAGLGSNGVGESRARSAGRACSL